MTNTTWTLMYTVNKPMNNRHGVAERMEPTLSNMYGFKGFLSALALGPVNILPWLCIHYSVQLVYSFHMLPCWSCDVRYHKIVEKISKRILVMTYHVITRGISLFFLGLSWFFTSRVITKNLGGNLDVISRFIMIPHVSAYHEKSRW